MFTRACTRLFFTPSTTRKKRMFDVFNMFNVFNVFNVFDVFNVFNVFDVFTASHVCNSFAPRVKANNTRRVNRMRHKTSPANTRSMRLSPVAGSTSESVNFWNPSTVVMFMW